MIHQSRIRRALGDLSVQVSDVVNANLRLFRWLCLGTMAGCAFVVAVRTPGVRLLVASRLAHHGTHAQAGVCVARQIKRYARSVDVPRTAFMRREQLPCRILGMREDGTLEAFHAPLFWRIAGMDAPRARSTWFAWRATLADQCSSKLR